MNQAQTQEGFDRARRELIDAGRNLWLAGLGAVAEVEEGSREWFDHLVERGRPVGDRQRKAFEEIEERTGTTVREMKKLVEDTVEYESKGLLKRLGLMTRDDVKVLTARVDTLAGKIDELVASYAIAEIDELETTETTPTAKAVPKSRRTRRPKS